VRLAQVPVRRKNPQHLGRGAAEEQRLILAGQDREQPVGVVRLRRADLVEGGDRGALRSSSSTRLKKLSTA